MATVAPAPARARTGAAPGRLAALIGVGALAVLAVSLWVRTRALGGGLWMDEGLSIGIASHGLADLPGVLRQDGSPPLYYALLHGWMALFGETERATHALSVLLATGTVPVAGWAGWTLFGRRTGLVAGALAALNPFLTVYATETRMYALVVLLSTLTFGAYLHVYAYGRRRYLPLFAVALALALYTHIWAVFLGVALVLALVPLGRMAADRRALARDAALGFGGAALLYAPWLPTLLFQVAHTGAPWTEAPRLGAPVQVSHWLLGGTGPTIAVLLGAGLGLAELRRAGDRRLRASAWAALVAFAGTLAVAWLASQLSPAWNQRYFAAAVGPLLLGLALGFARGGRVALVALALVAVAWVDPRVASVGPKSNARELAAQVAPGLRRGDVVVTGQPEQVALLQHYLPTGLRYVSPAGPAPDPRVMDWRDAMDRLERANPREDVARLIDGLRAGQRVILVRPVTEFGRGWSSPWLSQVRRRAAEWGGALAADRRLRRLGAAPRFYRQVNYVGVRSVLYERRGP